MKSGPRRPKTPSGYPLVVVPEDRLGKRPGIVLQQAPSARALAQNGPAAVGKPAESLPVLRFQPEEATDGRPDRAAMAHHDERARVRKLAGVLQDHRSGPVGDLGLQLAAAPAHGLATLPRGVLLAVLLDDLLVGEPLPGTGIRLAQCGVVCDVEAGDRGELAGRGRRPPQVGGDDRVRLQ